MPTCPFGPPPKQQNYIIKSAVDDEGLKDEDTFHDGLTDFYHVWTLAEAFLLDSMPLPAAPLLRWLKMFLQSNEEEGSRAELEQAESAALGGDAVAQCTSVQYILKKTQFDRNIAYKCLIGVQPA